VGGFCTIGESLTLRVTTAEGWMAEVVGPRPKRIDPAPRPTSSLPRSLVGRFSTGHLVMIVAGLLGLLLTVAVLRRADERQPVAVAARDLSPGSALGEASVRYEQVKMDDALLGTGLQPEDVERLRDAVAAYPIAAGELIHRRAVRPAAAPEGKRAMSIAIDPSRAVDGELEAGDRVDVILAGSHEVSIIVADAEVLSVGRRDRGGAFGGVDDKFTVTIAVDARESQLVAGGVAGGDIVITRTTGSQPAGSTPPLAVDATQGAGGGR
jgi:pilus assembly protein CpaB